MSDISDYSFKDFELGAIPDAQTTKQEIFIARRQAKEAIKRFQKKKVADRFYDMRAEVLGYFYEVRQNIKPLLNNDLDFHDLRELDDERPKEFEDWTDIAKEDEDYWIELYERLEEAVYELNLTDISTFKNEQPHGYEFLSGLDHSLDTGMSGFRRLMKNMDNMRELLRQDADLVGVIWGGNRTGKTTLSLICCDRVQYGAHKWDLPQDHMIFNHEDFSNALNEHERYSAEHIDEMSLLFHKKDSMNTEQKARNKMLKTFSKKNMFILGCENNIYNIDQETLNDKIDFAIEIPERGRFKFYSKAKLKRFEKDSEGEPDTPRADFKGKFPNLAEHSHGKKLWNRYKQVEDKKLDVEEEEDKEDPEDRADRLKRVAESICEDPNDYIKELEGRDPIIDKGLVRVHEGLSENDAKDVKALVENKIEVSEYVE